MGNTSLQPEPQSPDTTLPPKSRVPIRLCGTLPIDVVPAENYVEKLWAVLDQTLLRSKCGVGSDTPVCQGGTLDMRSFTKYLPEIKVAVIVKHTIQALPPRIIAVHGPTGTGKSTVFPLAITHWTEHACASVE